jgi:hypothetical protein
MCESDSGDGGNTDELPDKDLPTQEDVNRSTGIEALDRLDYGLRAGNLGNKMAAGLGGLVVSLAAAGVGSLPNGVKSPGGPLGDSRQGSNSNGQSAEAQRGQTIITAAAKKEDDARRATRGKTILTAPNIRKPVLSKKEPLGVSGTLG